jgi:hypothetical protein
MMEQTIISLKRRVRKIMGNDTTVLIRGLQNIYIDDSPDQKLQQFRSKFQISKAFVDEDLQNDRELTYDGTHEVTRNINDTNTNAVEKKSNQPYNIAYELIESQVNNNIPLPAIKSKRLEYKYQAKMIEDALKNDIADTSINLVNDKNERTTCKQGYSAVEVMWDGKVKGNDYLGELKLMQRHPKSIVPQAGVWDAEYLDYFFTVLSVTKQYIWSRFGKKLDSETEQYPEVNNTGNKPTNNLAELVSLITAWYVDSEDDTGCFSWVQNTWLEDKPKYFYRRPNKCKDCGAIGEPNQTKCECGGKYSKDVEKFEVLAEDKTLNRTEKVPNFGLDADGNVVQDYIERPVVIPKGTEIPYFAPKGFPVIFRTNVPSDFGFGGVSDIDVIKDKYVLISKLMNNIEEKLLKGGYIITCPDNMKLNLTNNIYQVVKGTMTDLMGINVKDLSLDVQKDLQVVQVLYDQAKSLLGVTDSWQGKPDSSASSGIAKQLQIAQSSGRMASKEFNKYNFYQNLYKMMFWMKLAFYDEVRPVVAKEVTGEDRYFDFDKYEFLLKDREGKWYYNTDFQFGIDATGGWERNRDYMYQQIIALYGQSAFVASDSAIMLWSLMDNLNFPSASEIKTNLIKQLEGQKEALVKQQEMANNLQADANSQVGVDGKPIQGV